MIPRIFERLTAMQSHTFAAITGGLKMNGNIFSYFRRQHNKNLPGSAKLSKLIASRGCLNRLFLVCSTAIHDGEAMAERQEGAG